MVQAQSSLAARLPKVILASTGFLVVWLLLGYGWLWYLHGPAVPVEPHATGFESAVNAGRSLSLGVLLFTAPIVWLVHLLTLSFAARGSRLRELWLRSALAALLTILLSALVVAGFRATELPDGTSMVALPLVPLALLVVIPTVIAAGFGRRSVTTIVEPSANEPPQ